MKRRTAVLFNIPMKKKKEERKNNQECNMND